MKNRRLRKKKLIKMLGGKCVDCNKRYNSCVIDFDHINTLEKSVGVCSILDHSWKKLFKEAKKCELRCANCHRIKTFENGELLYV